MKRRIVSFKLQSFLALIPFLGFVIVSIIGCYNIYQINGKKIQIFIFYCFSLIPMIIFGGVAVLILTFFISIQDSLTLKLILSLLLIFIILICIAVTCLGIQKGMIQRLLNKKGRQTAGKDIE